MGRAYTKFHKSIHVHRIRGNPALVLACCIDACIHDSQVCDTDTIFSVWVRDAHNRNATCEHDGDAGSFETLFANKERSATLSRIELDTRITGKGQELYRVGASTDLYLRTHDRAPFLAGGDPSIQ
jgi:hypothetical protein